MSFQIAIIDWLFQEAAKTSSTDNPLLGSTLQSGDTIVGALLEDEWKLFRLAGFYHDQTVMLADGLEQKDWSKETQEKIDYFVNLKHLLEMIVQTNVLHRLGWKYFKTGFLEDGSIVTFSEMPPPNGAFKIRAFELNADDVCDLLGGGDPKKMN